MTIDEAIEVKTRWKMQNYPPPLADEINADNLSIEALDFYLREKKANISGIWTLLPGETK